ncbi:MAG TPA: hypothetical protein VN222_13325 [Novosphingobium sp.]|nr:hypothetical protein [Novosphingobium sp.]
MDRWLPLILTVGLSMAALRAVVAGRRQAAGRPFADGLLYWGFLALVLPLAGWFVWQALIR